MNQEERKEASGYFEINIDMLIEQWSTFCRDYFLKGCEMADARDAYEREKRVRDVAVDEKKNELALVEAQLDRDIRQYPKDFGVDKITEPVVERTVLLQPKYQAVRKAMLDVKHAADEKVAAAKHAMDIHEAYIDAMTALKKGLESMTYLHQNMQNAEPKARGDIRNAVADAKIDRALGKRRLAPHE